ncbi:di-heme oxidoredictase family protein [Pseudoalteromonas phenolica]|uniref:di-heme oxidoreductase family protein n=1 Tax=Pseudoalteromonas phenolica TaxID=161398 RepID=UPI0020168C33|nr:di-heme oxidoredictase family protein [Pseudoalteromonas phenolica]
MNNKKSMLALIIALISLQGCGGGTNTQDTDTPTNSNNNGDNTSEGNQGSKDNLAFPDLTLNDGLPVLLKDTPDEFEHLAAGEASVNTFNEDAFSQALPTIVDTPRLDAVFKAGDHVFRSNHDGQGPIFNNTTCQGCHIKDGRGVVPKSANEPMISMFLRVGDSKGNVDPVYGDQIQVFGTIDGQTDVLAKHNGAIEEGLAYGEAYTWVEYEEVTGQFADGESYSLRKPIYKVKDLAYGEFNQDVQFSARVSPHVYGSGLLESIPAQSILAYADPDDTNNDGISGKAAFTIHPINNEKMLARFGQKAVTASVLQQISGAYRGDMGVTNTVATGEPCTEAQTACLAQAEKEQNKHHDGVDLNNVDLAQVEFYNRTLTVPNRRGFDTENNLWNDDVLKGRNQFFAANCHSCHVPRHKTGEAKGSLLGDVDLVTVTPESRTNIESLEGLVIYPYTDLLLHDMGGSCKVTRELASGEACNGGENCYYVQRCEGLADGRPEGDASGTEWKTPALWGLGLVQTVTPKATFLHDGRARTLSEAILWHGGEAESAKQAYLKMDKPARDALLAFLNSL